MVRKFVFVTQMQIIHGRFQRFAFGIPFAIPPVSELLLPHQAPSSAFSLRSQAITVELTICYEYITQFISDMTQYWVQQGIESTYCIILFRHLDILGVSIQNGGLENTTKQFYGPI